MCQVSRNLPPLKTKFLGEVGGGRSLLAPVSAPRGALPEKHRDGVRVSLLAVTLPKAAPPFSPENGGGRRGWFCALWAGHRFPKIQNPDIAL